MAEPTNGSRSKVEREVVLLKAAKELIDEMVNHEVMVLLGSDPQSEVHFRTATHQRLFNIFLVDFLSKTDKDGPVGSTSYLDGLGSIAYAPCFGSPDAVRPLREATDAFTCWLEHEIEVKTWFRHANAEQPLRIQRISFIRMCGNIAKHNILRASRVADELAVLLGKIGLVVEPDAALLALAEFYERFHTDILNYHCSTIAEFLNNIRWGIYDYLRPEYTRSYVFEGGEPPMYHYTYPEGVVSELAKECYWELMNEVRCPPDFRRFQVYKTLKLRD